MISLLIANDVFLTHIVVVGSVPGQEGGSEPSKGGNGGGSFSVLVTRGWKQGRYLPEPVLRAEVRGAVRCRPGERSSRRHGVVSANVRGALRAEPPWVGLHPKRFERSPPAQPASGRVPVAQEQRGCRLAS